MRAGSPWTPMTQIAIYQQEQTALIQTMAQDLNGSFTDRLEQVITGVAAPIQKSLEEFVDVNTQQQLRLIDKVAGPLRRAHGRHDGRPAQDLSASSRAPARTSKSPRRWCARAWIRPAAC